MDDFERKVKAAYERHLGQPLDEAVVLDIAATLRQWAHFLVESRGVHRAAPHVVSNTSQIDGKAHQERLPAKTDTPTGAPLRDYSAHPESSASLPEPPPLPSRATTQVNPHVSAGATVDGSP